MSRKRSAALPLLNRTLVVHSGLVCVKIGGPRSPIGLQSRHTGPKKRPQKTHTHLMGDTASTGGAPQLCKTNKEVRLRSSQDVVHQAGFLFRDAITCLTTIRLIMQGGGVRLQRLTKEGRKRKATGPLGTGGTHTHKYTHTQKKKKIHAHQNVQTNPAICHPRKTHAQYSIHRVAKRVRVNISRLCCQQPWQ